MGELLGPDGSTVISTTSEDAVPKEVPGFKITVGLAPYPLNAPRSHRKAVYATLEANDREVARLMRSAGKKAILGWVPITPEAASEVSMVPQGELAEGLAKEAVKAALQQALPLLHAAGLVDPDTGRVRAHRPGEEPE